MGPRDATTMSCAALDDGVKRRKHNFSHTRAYQNNDPRNSPDFWGCVMMFGEEPRPSWLLP